MEGASTEEPANGSASPAPLDSAPPKKAELERRSSKSRLSKQTEVEMDEEHSAGNEVEAAEDEEEDFTAGQQSESILDAARTSGRGANCMAKRATCQRLVGTESTRPRAA